MRRLLSVNEGSDAFSDTAPACMLRLDFELLRFHDKLSLRRNDEPIEDGVGGSSGLDSGGGDFGTCAAMFDSDGMGSMRNEVSPDGRIVLADSIGAKALEGVGAGARGPEGLREVAVMAEPGTGGGAGVAKGVVYASSLPSAAGVLGVLKYDGSIPPALGAEAERYGEMDGFWKDDFLEMTEPVNISDELVSSPSLGLSSRV